VSVGALAKEARCGTSEGISGRESAMFEQLDLFGHVTNAYADAGGRLTNAQLYERVAREAGIDAERFNAREPIGKSGQKHSVLKRKLRWFQQTLKSAGIVEHVPGERGAWRLANRTKTGLHEARSHTRVVAFSTNLGLAVFGRCESVLAGLDQPITLAVSSPPYLLRKSRAYGNPSSEEEYIDFLCRALEPVISHLAPGGSLCLNLSNDCFIPGSSARSIYLERLVIALCDRGMFLMDRIPWINPCKLPGPVQWASKARVQLNVGYEHILWFCNRPDAVSSDNRRVLEAHTKRHMALMTSGGEQREGIYGDGAYRLRSGAFGSVTEGRIPRNVLVRGHRCADALRYRADATALGLPLHGARQPLSVVDFLIRFLSKAGDLVCDPFGGTVTTGMAAELNGRRWLVVECMLEYLRASAERFRGMPGFRLTPAIELPRWDSA